MFLPLSVILAFIMWMFMSWIKLRVAKKHNKYKYKLDEKVLENMLKTTGSNKSVEEVLADLKKRRETEEDAKIKKTAGKNIFEEFDELRKGKSQRKTRTFDPDLINDPLSRMYQKLKNTKVKSEVNDEDKYDSAAVILKALQKDLNKSSVKKTVKKQCRKDD